MPSAYSDQKRESKQAIRDDIGGLMAELASKQQVNPGRRRLSGPERAAVLMLALGERYGGKIFGLLDDDELREISIVMSTLGTIDADSVEQLLLEFVSRMSACTSEAPRRLPSERSAPRKFALFIRAPCRFTPVRSACARFTPHKSALVPDSPPDSTQILC